MRLWQRQLQGRADGKEQINLTHSRWAGVVGWGWCSQFPVSLTCWSSLTLPLKVFQSWLCGCDLDSTRPTQQTCESHQLLSVSPTATRLRPKGRNHRADGYSSPQQPTHKLSLIYTVFTLPYGLNENSLIILIMINVPERKHRLIYQNIGSDPSDSPSCWCLTLNL